MINHQSFWAVTLLAFCLIGMVCGQEEDGQPEPVELSEKQATLLLLSERVVRISEELKEQEKLFQETSTEPGKSEIASEIKRLLKEKEETLEKISRVATGVDLDALKEMEQSGINFKEELEVLLEPIVREVKEATSSQQETEKLRANIAILVRQKGIADTAVENLEEAIDKTRDETLKATLESQLEEWQNKALEFQAQLSVAKYQLDERLENTPPVFDAISNTIRSFFRSRGTHLFIAVLAAVLVVFLLGKVRQLIMGGKSKKKRRKTATFAGRLINLLLILLTIVGGVVAFLLVLYIANDWVLLTLTVLLILGTIWAGKNAVPEYFEQAKLMLNLGPVRSGERINYQGIPWEVQRINPYTDLVNPQLEGGLIRLPLRDLFGLHSRPIAERELWFPCTQDDWVQLSDGTFGKVIVQTPETVHLVLLGGSRKMIPTAEFLSLHPENLSKNFRVKVVFGIDYAHQDIATEKVPLIFETAIKRGLLEKLDKDEMLSLKVFFTSAGASSLDYRVVADFVGEIAPRRAFLRDAINSLCVDVCNKHGWSIPFTQITVHQAEKVEVEEEETKPQLP